MSSQTRDTSNTTTTSSAASVVLHGKSFLFETDVHHEHTSAENDGHVNRKSLCGESDILRNRLLFPKGKHTLSATANSPTNTDSSTSTASLAAYCNNSIKNSFRTIMASESSTPSNVDDGGHTNAPLASVPSYPKCNISFPMNTSATGNSDQLAGSAVTNTHAKMTINPDAFVREPVIVQAQSLIKPKKVEETETVDVKPDISRVEASSSSSIAAFSIPVKTEPSPTVVATEPTVIKIPYDRERIINFLTDYWKSKNSQQVAEAQQQTAGVSGVNANEFYPGPDKIVEEALFDLFVEHPMVVDGLSIAKRAWAKAFYEKDIIQTSKVLFEALFSETEMQQCTLNGKKNTPELSAVKQLAIMRAAKWMNSNKKQDPYSFNAFIPSHNQFPTNEEREKIEKKVFTEKRSQANRKITKTKGNGDNGGGNEQNGNGETQTMDSSSTRDVAGAGPSPLSGEPRLSDDGLRENLAPLAKIPKLDLDSEVMKQLQMLYAENPEGLVSYLLPTARYVLIDGFLIPVDDWNKAFQEASTDHIKSAWTLFKVFFSKIEILNCTLNGKSGTKELCPLKKLAIIRAVTWMKENQNEDALSFNVRRPECNCYPTDEDKDKIETKVYTEKRYQACRKLKGQA